MNFYTWLQNRDSALFAEFETVGHSEDWSDAQASERRLNDPRYAARGVRSKYVANMKDDTKRKRKSRKGAK